MKSSIENFYTSALATAGFLASQHPKGSAYMTTAEDLLRFPYSPYYVLEGVGDIPAGA